MRVESSADAREKTRNGMWTARFRESVTNRGERQATWLLIESTRRVDVLQRTTGGQKSETLSHVEVAQIPGAAASRHVNQDPSRFLPPKAFFLSSILHTHRYYRPLIKYNQRIHRSTHSIPSNMPRATAGKPEFPRPARQI